MSVSTAPSTCTLCRRVHPLAEIRYRCTGESGGKICLGQMRSGKDFNRRNHVVHVIENPTGHPKSTLQTVCCVPEPIVEESAAVSPPSDADPAIDSGAPQSSAHESVASSPGASS